MSRSLSRLDAGVTGAVSAARVTRDREQGRIVPRLLVDSAAGS